MELSPDQKDQIRLWVQEGLSPSHLQSRLQEAFGLTLTYMETRFLIDDLAIDLPPEKEPEAAKPDSKAGDPAAPGEPNASAETAEWEDAGIDPEVASGSVTVSVDKVTRPGSVVSGDVVFGNGRKAGWQLDQYGGLGLIPGADDYRPTPEEIESFQVALQKELQKQGF